MENGYFFCRVRFDQAVDLSEFADAWLRNTTLSENAGTSWSQVGEDPTYWEAATATSWEGGQAWEMIASPPGIEPGQSGVVSAV